MYSSGRSGLFSFSFSLFLSSPPLSSSLFFYSDAMQNQSLNFSSSLVYSSHETLFKISFLFSRLWLLIRQFKDVLNVVEYNVRTHRPKLSGSNSQSERNNVRKTLSRILDRHFRDPGERFGSEDIQIVSETRKRERTEIGKVDRDGEKVEWYRRVFSKFRRKRILALSL